MRAMVYESYGAPDVLHLKEIERPTPKPNEVLVEIHAATVTAGDVRMRKFDVPTAEWLFARLYLGVFRPRRPILGMEMAGTVVALGRDVTRFKLGDQVYGSTMQENFGGYTEYKTFAENGLITHKPSRMSFTEAAAVPIGGGTALRMLRKANVQAGQRVLIYGASGSLGSYAVQIARMMGARVSAVCSTANLEWVKALGADEVIDYTRKDVAALDARFDVVFDTVDKLPADAHKKLLKPGGPFLSAHGNSGHESVADLDTLREWIDAGQLSAVVDRCYPFEEAADAHAYVELGHKKGNVVLTIKDA